VWVKEGQLSFIAFPFAPISRNQKKTKKQGAAQKIFFGFGA